MIVKAFRFCKETQLLEKLKNQDYVKLNKQKTYAPHFPPSWGDNPKIIAPLDFKDTTICAINMKYNPDLLIFDCDNVYSYNYVVKLLKDRNISTTITKSLYGGHIYFKYTKNIPLTDICPNIESHSSNKIEEAQTAKYMKIQFFSSLHTESGNALIFDGYDNKYYKVVNYEEDLPELPDDLFEFFYNMGTMSKEGSSLPVKNSKTGESKFVTFNKKKAEFAIRCIDTGNINIDEFQSLYYGRYKYDYNNLELGRNRICKSIFSSFASCGFLELEELKKFVTLFYDLHMVPDQFYVKGETRDEFFDELDRTVFNGKQFEKNFCTPSESKKLLRRMTYENLIVMEEEPLFIAKNEEPKSSATRFLFCDFRNPLAPSVTYLANRSILEDKIENYPRLKALHIRHKKDDKGNTIPYISEKTMPVVMIDNETNSDVFIKHNENYSTIYLRSLLRNKLINEVKEQLEVDLDDIEKRFEKTIFNTVLSRNLFPNRQVYLRFLNDLSYYILNPKSYPVLMCILQDVMGSTGKDSVLYPYLMQLIFGDYVFTKPMENSYKPLQVSLCNRVSAETFLNEKFNSFLKTKLFVINEDGGDIKSRDLNRKLQDIIKVDKIKIRDMQVAPREYPNEMFPIRFTNSPFPQIDESETNTRFYVSEVRRDITLNEWHNLFKDCKGENQIEKSQSAAKEEQQIILEYLIHVIPNKYMMAREDLPEVEYSLGETSAETLEELHDEVLGSTDNPDLSICSLLSAFVDNRKTINKNLCLEIINETDMAKAPLRLKRLAEFFYHLTSPQYQFRYGDDLADYYTVQKTIRLLKEALCITDRLKSGARCKRIIIQKFTNGGNNRKARITYKGEKNENTST